MDIAELPYLVAISSISGIGPARIKVLIDVLKLPSAIWQATNRDIMQLLGPKIASEFLSSRSQIDPEVLFAHVQKSNISVVTVWDDGYPVLLKQIPDPPPILYYRGDLTKVNNKSLGLVGTRKPTLYGREVTEFFARELSNQGFSIVSGLARGVDSLAHQTTLANSGFTIAVLGGGLNKIYPSENQNLADKIATSGLLVSEFPPDFPPNPGTFPARNRIISGLSLGILITEAAQDSGSLITADCALEQNREVFAVPGPVFSKQSEGTAKIIKQGAKLVTNVSDILTELGYQSLQKPEKVFQPANDLQKVIVALLASNKVHIDEFSRELKIPSSQISSELSLLEIQGVVKSLGSGYYSRAFVD